MNESKYLLDSDTIIDLIKERYQILQKIESIGITNCFVSEITIGELHFGVHYSSNYEKQKSEPLDISASFNILPISEVLALFGREKARLRKNGNLIADHDLWIGTTAVRYDLIMVTSNTKHFSRIKDIVLQDWRDPNFNGFIEK
ncbi:MAG: PIN domain-containing protein [Bacteroidota bacterium]